MTLLEPPELRPLAADAPAGIVPAALDGVALARLYGEPLFKLPQDLYIPPDALQLFLEAFEGPLDLLLYLIRRQNFNILDIPLASVPVEVFVCWGRTATGPERLSSDAEGERLDLDAEDHRVAHDPAVMVAEVPGFPKERIHRPDCAVEKGLAGGIGNRAFVFFYHQIKIRQQI